MRTPLAGAALAGLLLGLAAPLPAEIPAGAWRPAPLYGGDVRSLAFAPDDPDVALAGTSAGHVVLSRDGGASWRDAGAAVPFAGWVVDTLHFDLAQPSRLWVALWHLSGSGRVAYSDDLGRSWHDAGGQLPDEQVYALASIPQGPGRLYAGTRSGVWATSDDGRSWRHLSAEHPEIVTVSSLLVDREDPRQVLAGTWQRAWRTTTGGRTWQPAFEGMYWDTHLFSLHPVSDQPGHLWTSTCGWVYKSEDAGASWRRFQNGFGDRRVASFQVLPGGRLLAGTFGGVHSSDDDGASWHRRTAGDLVVHALAHHPARPERVLAGTAGGMLRSEDRGETFHPASHGLTNLRVRELAVDAGTLLAQVSYAGASSGLYRLAADGRFEPAGGATLPAPATAALPAPSGEVLRVLATGDERFSGIALESSGARLRDRAADRWLLLELPIPMPSLAAAAVHGGKLYLGTVGYGLWWARLPAAPATVAAGRATAAPAAEAAPAYDRPPR